MRINQEYAVSSFEEDDEHLHDEHLEALSMVALNSSCLKKRLNNHMRVIKFEDLDAGAYMRQ